MMVTNRPRRTREVTGPTPHSVAIFARPTNRKLPEQLIIDRRRQDEIRDQAEQISKYNKLSDIKNDWQKATDRKIQINTVKRKVQSLMQANQFAVEERRERLRQLLAEEEQQYIVEMANKEETVLERQAKMRERAKQLKEKRESERLAFVESKLEQQWRDQCEELRSTTSKRHTRIVAEERKEQLVVKKQQKEEAAEEERMYADLWYADIAAKMKREEADTQRQMKANLETLETLNQQMAALEAQKQQEKRLKEEEAELLKEQAQLRKIEEMQAQEEKRQKQMETRHLYERSLKMKMDKQNKELQEQLAFDLKILEQLVEESRNEAREEMQRKKELREQDKRYRQYLQQLKEEEERQEKELDKLCDEEVEKMWQKRLAQWRLEKEARRKLLHDVLGVRRQQVQERLLENERKLAEAAQERTILQGQIEENRRLEQEQIKQEKEKNLLYQSDLLSQMQYNQRLRHQDLQEEERMWLAQREAENEYRRKLEDALADPEIEKLHPMRQALSGESSRSRSRHSGLQRRSTVQEILAYQ